MGDIIDSGDSVARRSAPDAFLREKAERHPQRVDLPPFGDERRGRGLRGKVVGTNGVRTLAAIAAIVLLGAAICTVNALSILHDAARTGEDLPAWRPWATEYTSLFGLIVALPIAVVAERMASREGRLGYRILTFTIASACFSFVHILAMVGARELLWWGLAGDYSFDVRGDWFYEYRKDLIAYGIAFSALALGRRLWPDRAGDAETEARAGEAWLGDGRRTVGVDPAELRVARAAGNYVELIFGDGRRRLLRTTMDAAAAALMDHGFRRTHKSWLINEAAVIAMERTAAGDFRLVLDGGIEAIASRRHRAVIDDLKLRLHTARDQ